MQRGFRVKVGAATVICEIIFKLQKEAYEGRILSDEVD